MKKQNLLVSFFAIACLVSCTKPSDPSNSGDSNSGTNPPSEDTVVINDFGTVKLEAENFNVANWVPDDSYNGQKVIEDSKASGGKYLAAGKFDSTGTATFHFELKKHSIVVFSAAFSQIEGHTDEALDMSKMYAFDVESVDSFTLPEGKSTLEARASSSIWELMTYGEQNLYAGTYNVTMSISADADKNCPNLDYVQFKTSDAEVTPVDPSKITESDIPANDFRNLQQYKFLQEKDLTKYKTYATGADLSAPRGIKLDLSDFGSASKYYVQISKDSSFTDAAVRESDGSVYTWYNAELGAKYYYRAAASEAELANATAKNITITDVAPRVVYVPDVLNFRDIGGWDSELVPGGKVKQGLYFRCAQLDAASGSTKSCLDDAGKGRAALKELGIKLDIDMRDVGNQPNRGAGPSKTSSTDWPIDFLSVGVPSGSENARWEGGSGTWMGTSCDIAAQYVKIFNAIAECDEKPAMLHCTYGADRTGIVTFFLEALIGMSIEDMTRDYVWTQFTQGRNIKLTESDAEFPKWISKTNACEGSSFADKMENHLISFYPEDQQEEARATMEHIREIFVPGYVAKA